MALYFSINQNEQHKYLVVIIGLGRIGTAVTRQFMSAYNPVLKVLKSDWTEEAFKKSLDTLFDAIIGAIGEKAEGGLSETFVKILWCAGSAGFDSCSAIIHHEMNTYKYFLEECKIRLDHKAIRSVDFFLISSLGGLYEGIKLVTRNAAPKPKRDYGHLKFEQEIALHKNEFFSNKVIIRASSIYGYITRGHRSSLIEIIIQNGVTNKITEITGRATTLRDFVWADDFARIIMLEMVKNSCVSRILNISSFKPSSIMEVQNTISRILNRKLYFQYNLYPRNAEDITTTSIGNLLFDNYTDLTLGAKKIYLELLQSGCIANALIHDFS